MSETFTPTAKFSSNERDWQAEIGLLPWTTSIVFTKESLVRFLKTIDVQVDPNMSQLKKLPNYARCGTLSQGDNQVDQVAPPASVEQPHVVSTQKSDVPAFIPTRKVREQPGGGSSQIASLLGGDWEEDNVTTPVGAAKTVPQQEPTGALQNSHHSRVVNADNRDGSPAPRVMNPDGSVFVPTRKVREPVGGHSSMASLLAGDQ